MRGDTLFLIAKAHEVTVDELREWNGIEGDLIEVGQVLRIHTGPVEVEVGPTPSTRNIPMFCEPSSVPTSTISRSFGENDGSKCPDSNVNCLLVPDARSNNTTWSAPF